MAFKTFFMENEQIGFKKQIFSSDKHAQISY